MTPQRWFAERTYHAADFDVDVLAKHKDEVGATVSVVLPARNEADTVGGMVAAAVELGGVLVDEVVVIDGSSEDATAERAAAAGARVHTDAGLLPDHGPPRGKGDALWRSLSVTSGDIVVFCDADIRNPSPAFIFGLLGPLLTDPGLEFVKAFYDRPVAVGDGWHPTGGGRVTELLARPLLNLRWPDLAAVVQPLSGEYAARRRLLQRLPFFTGYGVDFGLLIDTYQRAGLSAMAQVDLGQRVHRNQPLSSLSRMAFEIAQVAFARLGTRPEELPTRYHQFARAADRVELETADVVVLERPPAARER